MSTPLSTPLSILRRNKKLSQAEFSELSGVSLGNLRKLEQGVTEVKKCNVMTVINLARALDITVEELVKMHEQ